MKQPVFFLSHGGGPWPWVEHLRGQYRETERVLRELPATLPDRPRAVLVISGHWEAAQFSIATAAHPPMEYDYYGFPPHTYELRYPAPGEPQLAAQVRTLLAEQGIATVKDPQRGFDHGVFVPMSLMYPQADMPVLMLSINADYDAAAHLALGAALAPLRDKGVLIVGSGLTYHNMRGFNRPESTTIAAAFEAYLAKAVSEHRGQARAIRLLEWEQAPCARLAHPREDHLLPLMVAAGAAGDDEGRRLVMEEVMQVAMVSYRFG